MNQRHNDPRIGASLVLWHSDLDQVSAAVGSLAAQEQPITQIAMVINDDGDLSVARAVESHLSSLLPGTMRLTVRSRADNTGFAGGQNIGLATLFDAGCDYALVLNPDVLLDPACSRALTDFAAGRGGPMLAGPLLERASANGMNPAGTIDSAGIRWTWTGRHLDALQDRPMNDAPRAPTQVRGITGAAMLVTADAYRRLIDATGEFFDATFIAYREDAELALRAEKCGLEMWLVPAAHALHVRKQRGTHRGDAHIDRLSVRNRFLIAFKHGWTGRPGGPGAIARDLVVIAGVVARERGSWPGVVDAWRLRREMRAKGRRLRDLTRTTS